MVRVRKDGERRGQVINGVIERKDDLGGGQWKVHVGRFGQGASDLYFSQYA